MHLCARVLLLTVAAAGCNNSNGSPACAQYDACQLVTQVEAQMALGDLVGVGMPGMADSAGDDTHAEVKSCTYPAPAAGKPSVTVLARCSPVHDNDPASLRSQAVAAGFTVTDVAGVGDSAFWAFRAAGSTGQLNAFVGTDIYLDVTVGSVVDAAGAQTAARSLATTALSRMPPR
jgi:hypothetical protein